MKLKSLLLGSIAATGLSAGAFAADLNVLTSLDVCDSLGISGLTISSDTNCLQITGEVSYEFAWGNFAGGTHTAAMNGTRNIGFVNNYAVMAGDQTAAGVDMDWYSRADAYLQFVGTAESDFGPASATIKLDWDADTQQHDEGTNAGQIIAFATGNRVRVENGYVSVGDSTVIMAGMKSSILDTGSDVELTWLSLYNSEVAGDTFGAAGVETNWTDRVDGGPQAGIQVVSDLGNGFSISAGLENLDGANSAAPAAAATGDGNAIGVLSYKGDTVSGHVSLFAAGFLDGTIEAWGTHAAINATVDMFKFVAALAADSTGEWEALASASATFDMFTLAAAIEGNSGLRGVPASADQWGVSVSGSAAVTDAVTLNLGFRYYDQDVTLANTELWQAAAGLAFAATETITLTGEVGVHGTTMGFGNVVYGSAEAAWAPGGGYTTSLKGEVNSANAYKVTYKAKKSFK